MILAIFVSVSLRSTPQMHASGSLNVWRFCILLNSLVTLSSLVSWLLCSMQSWRHVKCPMEPAISMSSLSFRYSSHILKLDVKQEIWRSCWQRKKLTKSFPRINADGVCILLTLVTETGPTSPLHHHLTHVHYMHMHTHCPYACAHVHARTRMHTHTNMHAYTNTCMHKCMHAYTHTHTHTHPPSPLHKHTQPLPPPQTHTHIRSRAHARTHTHMHTNTHTHTHADTFDLPCFHLTTVSSSNETFEGRGHR